MVDMLCSIVKFKQYLLCPTRDGRVITWDLERKEHALTYARDSGHDLDNAPFGLFSGRVDYATRSLYYFCVKAASTNDIQFYVLRIQFPENNSPKEIHFTPISKFTVPYPSIIDMYILDTEKRVICAIFLTASKTIGVHIIFDWATEVSTFVDTGMAFVFRKSVVVAHLASDGDTLVVRAEHCGKACQKTFSLSSLQGTVATRQILPKTIEAKERNFDWTKAESESELHRVLTHSHSAPYRVWTLHPWWPAPSGVPKRTSTIVLYVHTPEIADPDALPPTPARRWIIGQHYATDSKLCGAARSVLHLRDPAPVRLGGSDGLPMLGISFGHVVWIERVLTWRGPRRVRKRVAKLASFPDPCDREEVTNIKQFHPIVRTLDIPERILKVACHLIVDPSSASISVTTETNSLFTFNYA